MSSYHGWTHVPKAQGGTDPIPGLASQEYEWAYVAGIETVSANNNTPTTITWLQYAFPSSLTAIVREDAVTPFKLVKEGFYMFWLNVEWTATGYTDVREYRLHSSGGGFWHNNDATYEPRIAISDPYLNGFSGSFGPLHSNGGTHKISVIVTQSSGASKDFNTGRFTCLYLGPGIDIDDGVTDWSDLITDF